ncbi:hypothetical protein [Paraglaciecola arctica]|uniref:Lipoprotein n=1 Tax=Paraglaciecola arctica BSs20135 TaxID=493475 RepID=K6YD88_9ALTE|nr:hypothetical protein [Paraglaciecola arctica]GAC21896.1 hypothetical protein GARC_4961 [Paraglaciecola arctica BSs20135]
MTKIITLFIAALITGCTSYTPYEKQIPSLNKTHKEPVYFSVLDQRERIQKKRKPNSFIGVYRVSFGIPVSKTIKDITDPKDPRKNDTLAEFIQARVVDGIKNAGGEFKVRDLNRYPDTDFIKKDMKDGNVNKWVIMKIKEWYFSTDMHFNTSFNFDSDVEVLVYNSDAKVIFQEVFKNRDIIDENSDRHNDILRAYKSKLQEIFNSIEI